jgi:sugar transferase (PEP-CTERM/EpsH1 system associated)
MRGGAVTPAVFYKPRLARQIVRWHEQRPFDAVLTFCTGMVRYARFLYGAVTRPPRVHVLDLVDVDSVKWAAFARTSSRPMRWVFNAESQRLREVEAGRFDHFDAISVISDREAQIYREQVCPQHRLIVAGNGTDLSYFHAAPYPGGTPSGKGGTILFVGVLDYLPNIQAVTWFSEAVLPRVRQQLPEARFVIVGRNPTPAVRQLAQRDGVQVTGSVPDVRPYLAEASVVVAPMTIAPGVQNKVLEALASARPVVCSPGAAAGLEPATAEHLRLAETASGYTEHLIDLLTHPDKARELGQRARDHVATAYTWPSRLAPLIEPLAAAGLPAWIREDRAIITPQAA